jgi:hypothetical protein
MARVSLLGAVVIFFSLTLLLDDQDVWLRHYKTFTATCCCACVIFDPAHAGRESGDLRPDSPGGASRFPTAHWWAQCASMNTFMRLNRASRHLDAINDWASHR